MSGLLILLGVSILFILAYIFYARRLERLWQIDSKRPTPAFAKYDSVDYIPAKNWLVLFGHHFASIAGAGPIIGPVIALMLWGWLPALLWAVFGTILIGGVHDFGALIISVREGGSSIADIAGHAISRRAKIIFALFVWLALILVIAVFAYLCADTFVKQPKIVLPSLGLIPVAMIVGFLLYRKGASLSLVTIFGLLALVYLMLLGSRIPITANLWVWLIILFAYSYLASVMPVNILLQPRDYLSSYLLFFGVIAGFIGILISRPTINMPPYHSWASEEGLLWPFLFITIACGAVSGFHALISSGTSSKQIANERHVRRIGYGAMIAEGLVAVLAIIGVAVLFNSKQNFAAILKNEGPINLFGRGYGTVTQGILANYGAFIAITILNAFILTTLDTATRISRYLTEELFKVKNRYLSTLFIVILSATLAFSGQWSKIWPAFGASNQLVAALALFVISCWLMSKKKTVKFTLLPALFMFITTVSALILQAKRYLASRDILLFVIDLSLIILAVVMIGEVINSIIIRRKINA